MELVDLYFDWVSYMAVGDRIEKYSKLLRYLFTKKFRYLIPNDANRESDGISLRYRFACQSRYPTQEVQMELNESLRGCSVLEMMVALCLRCEESVMHNFELGDRTGLWFQEMLNSLGINFENDDRYFDYDVIDSSIERFLDRQYAPNGEGGLFTIPYCTADMRNAELWYQAMWWLDSKLNM